GREWLITTRRRGLEDVTRRQGCASRYGRSENKSPAGLQAILQGHIHGAVLLSDVVGTGSPAAADRQVAEWDSGVCRFQ
ncbi:MAG: hypothetical protein RLZZ515_2556, partial [Cyanobacteriota bacterium]